MSYICKVKQQKDYFNPNEKNKMIKTVRFTKMHGAGNDYIYVDTMKYPIDNPEKLSVLWSAPHTGIGSDGLVLIGRSDKADFKIGRAHV